MATKESGRTPAKKPTVRRASRDGKGVNLPARRVWLLPLVCVLIMPVCFAAGIWSQPKGRHLVRVRVKHLMHEIALGAPKAPVGHSNQ